MSLKDFLYSRPNSHANVWGTFLLMRQPFLVAMYFARVCIHTRHGTILFNERIVTCEAQLRRIMKLCMCVNYCGKIGKK